MIAAIISVIAVAATASWAAGVGPFGNDGTSVESVESLVAARESGASASCRPVGEGAVNGKTHTVYRCRVTGSKNVAYISACYWVRQDKTTKKDVLVAELAC